MISSKTIYTKSGTPVCLNCYEAFFWQLNESSVFETCLFIFVYSCWQKCQFYNMDSILMKMNQMFSDKTLQVRGQSLKTAKLVIEAVEEERRRTKHQEELIERITAANQQVHSVCNENSQLVEENRTIARKRMNNSNQLKIEQKKAEDFQATIIKERNSKFHFTFLNF